MSTTPPGDLTNRRGWCQECGEIKGLVPVPPGGHICPRCWEEKHG